MNADVHHGAGVKSIRIEKENAGQATGFWKGITSTEEMTFTYTVGITSTTNDSEGESSAEKLKKSLERGWNASVSVEAKGGVEGAAEASASATAGGSGSNTEEDSREHTIASEIANTANVGTTTSHTTKCTPKADEKRVGLWQWVITTEDYSTTAFTSHTICRTGINAYESPKCSFWDCANVDCTACVGDKEKKAD